MFPPSLARADLKTKMRCAFAFVVMGGLVGNGASETIHNVQGTPDQPLLSLGSQAHPTPILSRHAELQRTLQGDDNATEIDLVECPICGEDKYPTIKDAEVAVPTQQQGLLTLTCEELEENGKTGNVSSIECALIQPLVQDLCGCVSEDASTPPVSSPSESPIGATDPPSSDGVRAFSCLYVAAIASGMTIMIP